MAELEYIPLPDGVEMTSPEANEIGPVDLDPYLNMVPGRTLVYQDFANYGSGLEPDKLEAVTVVALAQGFLAEVWLEGPNFTPDWVDMFQPQVDGFHWFGSISLISSEYEWASPPPGPIDGAMYVGETRTFDYWVIESSGSFPVHTEMALLQAGITFTTPAGSFPDCVVIRFSEGDGDHYEVWARNVGTVFSYELELGVPESMLILAVAP